ncbi:MAG: membrane protein insertase YidC [Bacteroidales bacterium]|nr:membrane protein insertase YidC [Bacteroidales bacterium]
MDRNTIFGIILIAGIFIIWGVLNKPSSEELEKQKAMRDSLALVEQIKQKEQEIEALKKQQFDGGEPTAVDVESTKKEALVEEDTIENRIFTIENDLISLKVSEKGGRPYSVQLKNYQTHDSLPIYLFHGDSSSFGFNFFINNRPVNTNTRFFKSQSEKAIIKVKDKPETLSMRLEFEGDKYIEYRYTLEPGKYQVDMDIELNGMSDLATQRTGVLDLNWMIYSPQQEKGRDNESNYTTLYYKLYEDDVDFFNARTKKDPKPEIIPTRVEWVAYKDQFFSSVLMADDSFVDAEMQLGLMPQGSQYIKRFESTLGLSYNQEYNEVIPLHFYFGPNKYKLLKKQYGDKQLQDLVTVGKGIIKWINQIVIINLFDFLSKYIGNYGIIILIMTIIIKVILLPLTFKSFMSTAKMKVLKPQIDKINEKIPKEKAMERQQATMALYKKVGVSPLGGCLPMLLQMPILFAMFRFFPTSIELRQEGFLWAHDLSTYDSVLEWDTYIPFLSNTFGNHLSLFTLLMTISTILTMKINNQAQSSQQMPGMQSMMYVMPIMFMFILNKFSAGLTYYYFLANLITFGQNLLFKQFIDEEELLQKLESKKAKPKKKSNFQRRMEELARQQASRR